MILHELGYFGNVWIRQNLLEKKGDQGPNHKHAYDHVTLLAKGSVSVQVEGHEPKKFQAPTFIVIRKEHNHQVTALENDTIYYCVFALRDIDGEIVDPLFANKHDPLSYVGVEDDYWKRQENIDKTTSLVKE